MESHTVVDPTVLKALELDPRRIAQTITPTTGAAPHKCYTYDVSIHVPLGTTSALFSKLAWEVTCLDLKHQGFEVLLGRDILAEVFWFTMARLELSRWLFDSSFSLIFISTSN